MSEEQDKSQKTEEPTDRKIEEARRKGNVAQSREAGTLMAMLSMALIVWGIGSQASSAFVQEMITFVEAPEDIRILDAPDVFRTIWSVISGIAVALGVMVAVLLVCALIGVLLQGEIVVASERIQPKLERISPRSGVKRLFSLSAMVEFIKNIVKLSAVAAAVIWALSREWPHAAAMVGMSAERMPELMQGMTLRLLLAAALIAAAIAVLDRVWKTFDWRRGLRMTRQEIKDETKRSEGDPQIKARRREIGRQRIRRRMMAAVPTATVVIVNPTHFAVALRYERGRDPAPICVAKGVDRIALRIREIAEENRVPVIEDPSLARVLHATTEIDSAIPPEQYQAVAEVISFVLGLSRTPPPARPDRN